MADLNIRLWDAQHYGRNCMDCLEPIFSYRRDLGNEVDFEAAQAKLYAVVQRRLNSGTLTDPQEREIAAIWGCLDPETTIQVLGERVLKFRRMFNILMENSRKRRLEYVIAAINTYDPTVDVLKFQPFEFRNYVLSGIRFNLSSVLNAKANEVVELILSTGKIRPDEVH